MKVGVLSNIAHPLLYLFIQDILKFGTKDIVIILDKKEQSKKRFVNFLNKEQKIILKNTLK